MWNSVSNYNLAGDKVYMSLCMKHHRDVRRCTHYESTHTTKRESSLKDRHCSSSIASEAVIHNVNVSQLSRQLGIEYNESNSPVCQQSYPNQQCQTSQTSRRFQRIWQACIDADDSASMPLLSPFEESSLLTHNSCTQDAIAHIPGAI